MVAIKKVMEAAHPVSNLPNGYESKPFSFDDKLGKWAVDISHPAYGSVSAYEDGVIVETQTGRGTILVAYTLEAFNKDYDILYEGEDINQEYRVDALQ